MSSVFKDVNFSPFKGEIYDNLRIKAETVASNLEERIINDYYKRNSKTEREHFTFNLTDELIEVIRCFMTLESYLYRHYTRKVESEEYILKLCCDIIGYDIQEATPFTPEKYEEFNRTIVSLTTVDNLVEKLFNVLSVNTTVDYKFFK